MLSTKTKGVLTSLGYTHVKDSIYSKILPHNGETFPLLVDVIELKDPDGKMTFHYKKVDLN